MISAQTTLSPLLLESITFCGMLLATVGTVFLAYDLLGRENGPLRWFALVLTGGLVSALVFVPVATLDSILILGLQGGLNLSASIIVPLVLFGGLMGLYTVILVDFSQPARRPPLLSWKGGVLGLALAVLFWLVGLLAGPGVVIPALALGLACALLLSTWQRLAWNPAQGGATCPTSGQVMVEQGPSAATTSPPSPVQALAAKPADARPRVFSYKQAMWGALLGYLLGVGFIFSMNRDVIASLLESLPVAFSGGVIFGVWRFINWEPPLPTPRLFSRKGLWTGLVAGFVPWLCWGWALSAIDLPSRTGPVKGFEFMRFQFFLLLVEVLAASANAAAGSIARYTLWRVNHLPHRSLGAFGLILIVIAFALQAVQPGIDIFRQMR
jgi:hypothetical protein